MHGESKAGQWTPEYRAWTLMIGRCYNPNSTRFENWGGRGIRVCGEWLHSYPAFLAYVGRKPSPEHSLDRIDNERDYMPGNVRWASPKEQSLNSRRTRIVHAFGQSMPLRAWADKIGMNMGTLWTRLDSGMDPEKAMSTPLRRRGIASNV